MPAMMQWPRNSCRWLPLTRFSVRPINAKLTTWPIGADHRSSRAIGHQLLRRWIPRPLRQAIENRNTTIWIWTIRILCTFNEQPDDGKWRIENGNGQATSPPLPDTDTERRKKRVKIQPMGMKNGHHENLENPSPWNEKEERRCG